MHETDRSPVGAPPPPLAPHRVRTTLEEYLRDPPTYAEFRGEVPFSREVFADLFHRVEQWGLQVDYLVVNPSDVVVPPWGGSFLDTALGLEVVQRRLKLKCLPPAVADTLWGALALKSDLVPRGHVVLVSNGLGFGRPPVDWLDAGAVRRVVVQVEGLDSPGVPFDPHVQLSEMVESYLPVPLDVPLRELLPDSPDWFTLGVYGIRCQISPALGAAVKRVREEQLWGRVAGGP